MRIAGSTLGSTGSTGNALQEQHMTIIDTEQLNNHAAAVQDGGDGQPHNFHVPFLLARSTGRAHRSCVAHLRLIMTVYIQAP